jgi:nucleoside 2-deoxyribosyltransferase
MTDRLLDALTTEPRARAKRAYLICPVRGHSPEETRLYVEQLEAAGWLVHWPPRDTNQVDPVGNRICEDNLRATEEADRVFVVFDPTSRGSLFDLGMAWALKKPITLLNSSLDDQEGKSFAKVLEKWSGI